MMSIKRKSSPLSVTHPNLIKEWNYEKNGSLIPECVFQGSHIKVWWKDSKNHVWEATLADRTRGRGCPYCSNRKVLVGYNDLQTTNPELTKEWHPTKNEFSPNDITAGSHKKAWWLCEKGHAWQAAIYNRSKNGSGCPICKNESKTSFPEQTILFYLSKLYVVYGRYKYDRREIDIYIPELVIGIEYDGVFYHSLENSKKRDKEKQEYLEAKGIRIIRIKEGDSNFVSDNVITYKYDANFSELPWAISELLSMVDKSKQLSVDLERDRQNIFSQFIFIEKQNSIANKYPQIASEWDYERNGKVGPDAVPYASNKKFWWKCSKGHEWQAGVSWRTGGNGCPYCTNQKVLSGYNDLLSINPVLAKEWHPTKNGALMPDAVTPHSRKKVWWSCSNGHEWQATIDSRTKNGCPYCSGKKLLSGYNDLSTTNPRLAAEWNYLKNTDIFPENVSANSHRKVWWVCSKCGYEWLSEIKNRNSGRGCPKCGRANAKATNGKLSLNKSGSLSETNQNLAKEWDYDRNDSLTPEDVTAGSNRKVWWKCSKCEYSWVATINSRNAGNGCPRCHGRVPKRVKCIETNTIYANASEAACSIGKSTSSITKCCSGILESVSGYHWTYID